MWKLQFGADVLGRGTPQTQFRVWAPRATTLALEILPSDAHPEKRTFSLAPEAGRDGVFSSIIDLAPPGTNYRYLIDDTIARPDPVSRYQPKGVHGPSQVVDPEAFSWTDANWRGPVSLESLVFYELHIGTFTPEGTFEAATRKLPHLKDLGITAVEIMPVAEFPGGRNWGYDGVGLFAPQSTYGGPLGLKLLVDACHQHGLSVVLDVVYNHLGPEGNYLSAFGPYFTDHYRTPWGDALNFDGPDSDEVRAFFINNALYWVSEFHVDALRLDAIHGIYDASATHILEALTDAVHTEAAALGRRAYVIAESDLNDPRIIESKNRGGYGVDAQWNDDFHHAVYERLTQSRRGYFVDFGRTDDIRKTIAESFVYDGQYSAFRRKRHGRSAAKLPGERFVGYIENHDQIANGSGGDRLSVLLTFEEQKLASALLISAPHLPLLFMGQEWGEIAPFLYFTSHGDPALVESVRTGRAREFASFGRTFPDPQSTESFSRSKLDWDSLQTPAHASLLRYHRDLLTLRAKEPSLHNGRKDLLTAQSSETEGWICVLRGDLHGPSAFCLFNLRQQIASFEFRPPRGNFRLALASSDVRYGGVDESAGPPSSLDFRSLASAETEKARIQMPPSSAAVYIEERHDP